MHYIMEPTVTLHDYVCIQTKRQVDISSENLYYTVFYDRHISKCMINSWKVQKHAANLIVAGLVDTNDLLVMN